MVFTPPSDYLEKLSCIVRQVIRDQHFALPSFLVFGYSIKVKNKKINIKEICIGKKPYYWPSNKSDMDNLDDTF